MAMRNIILIAILSSSYLAMVAYLSYRYPEQGQIFPPITFGILLVGVAVAGLKLSRGGRKRSGIFRVLKIMVASYAIAFAAWMLGSVLLLPVVGYEGFLLMGNSLFFQILIGAALLLSPFVAKRLA